VLLSFAKILQIEIVMAKPLPRINLDKKEKESLNVSCFGYD